MAKKHNRPPTHVPVPVVNTNPYRSFKQILAAAILILSTVIVYYPSLKVPFLLDDYGKIIRNPDIKSLANIPSRLIYPYESPPAFHRNDPSRPLTYLTFTLNYHFNQLEPYGYHIVNIALQGMVVLLVFILSSQLFPLRGISSFVPPLLSALFFAVHPINTNAVTYIIGRAASLSTVFYVLAVILFIQARHGMKWGITLSASCFVFALASNQLAITLPAIILITDFCFFGEGSLRKTARNGKQHAIYWGLLTIYLVMRLYYFGRLGDIEAAFPIDQTNYALTQWVVLWKYAGMVLAPIGLSFEHRYGPLQHVSDPRVLVAAALYGILWVGFRRGLKSFWTSTSFLLFGVLWFFITLSPTSSIFPTTATMAENRVYLPLIGLCLILPFIGILLIRRVTPASARTPLLITTLGTYAFCLGYLTWHRNVLYQDPAALWTDVIRRYPDHERAHKNLAIIYFNQGQFAKAIEEDQKALALDPNDFDARNNLAAVYYNAGNYRGSLATYEEILKEKPDYAPAYSNMGMAYEQLRNINAAVSAYQNAIRLGPMLIEPLNNLANLYLAMGRSKEAVSLFQTALRIDPHNAQILKNYERIKQ